MATLSIARVSRIPIVSEAYGKVAIDLGLGGGRRLVTRK